MKTFPLLISIPHGGDRIPSELLPYCNLSNQDIYIDGDPHTTDIYTLNRDVANTITAEVARCFIDLNRPVEDLPPTNPDGVIKTITLFGKSVYKNNWFPNDQTRELLLRKYYHPYYKSLETCRHKNIELFLDCHSMLPYPPSFGSQKKDSFKIGRPSICLGNLGDHLGNPIANQLTSCPKALMQQLADGFELAFKHEDITIIFNTPFKGGYITKYQSLHSKTPSIQVELNRELYMTDEYIDVLSKKTKKNRLDDLNQKFRSALQYFFS